MDRPSPFRSGRMKYLLDTPVLLDHLRGHLPATGLIRRLLDEDGELLTCEIVVAEIATVTPDELMELIGDLLDSIRYVGIDRQTARAAGSLRRKARSENGLAPSIADALVAAAARQEGATIVTRGRAVLARLHGEVLTY